MPKSKMTFLKWTAKKPKFDCECVVILACKIAQKWYYSIFQIQKIDLDGKWYWGWMDGEGSEYDDIEGMIADKYFVIPI